MGLATRMGPVGKSGRMSEVRRLKARPQGSKVLSEDSMRQLYSRACLGQAEVRRRGAGISDRHLEDNTWGSYPFVAWLLALRKATNRIGQSRGGKNREDIPEPRCSLQLWSSFCERTGDVYSQGVRDGTFLSYLIVFLEDGQLSRQTPEDLSAH